MQDKNRENTIINRTIQTITSNDATKIRPCAFYGCEGLTSAIIPNAASIGYEAFYNCSSLTSIIIPNVTKIGDGAFGNCSKLSSISSLVNVTSIGRMAFEYCISLTSIIIGNSTTIYTDSFDRCSNLKTVTLPSPYSGTSLPSNIIQNIIITEGSTSIGSKYFSDIAGYSGQKVTSLTVASTVSSISSKAFIDSSSYSMTSGSIRFLQPSGMSVSLPTAGKSNGMLYQKSSRALTIYTDNTTIKNYGWSSDGVNATLLHLDGTPW